MDHTKAKKYQLVGIALSTNDKIKTLKCKYCLSLGTCHKYVAKFTNPTPTKFWYAKRAKLTFLNMPLLHIIQ